MAIGNTFGATALSSYGGFWLSFAIILTPGGFGIATSYGGETDEFYNGFGFFLMVGCAAVSSDQTARDGIRRARLIDASRDGSSSRRSCCS